MNRLAVVSVAGGAPRMLAGKLDRGVSAPRFTARRQVDLLFLVADDRSEYPGTVPADGRRGAAARHAARASFPAIEQGKDGRMAVLAAGDIRHRRGPRARKRRLRALTHHNDALMARTETRRHRRIQLQGEGRQRGPRADRQAARLPGRQEVSDAAAHPRRPQRAGRARLQLRAADLRRQRLRRGGGELPRQFGARREIPDGDLRRLGQ